MAWYINDLSLTGQYQDASAFLVNLKRLMRQRQQIPILMRELLCSKSLHTRPVTPTHNFREAVSTDKAFVQPVLAWLTKNGPFWDDIRQSNSEDYFEYAGQDVTDQGLGESARCQLAGKVSCSVSFSDGGFNFTPVVIVQGLPEEPISVITIENIWDHLQLQNSALAAIPSPHNWQQMLEQSQIRFDRLVFSPKCIDQLTMQPFSAYVVERIFELLRVLNEFMECRNPDGTNTSRNQEIIDQHFSGDKAWFSDESLTNKRNFENELSFPDFEAPGNKVFCSWHGKIKSPQFRVHFEWPVASNLKLRVFYIGPKISKV